ncbi:MAG TPA: hypothetical protein PLX69_08090 [Leptospiraceae bacterium]|nr:hypothetical protein [Leptospiraceae bacterium]
MNSKFILLFIFISLSLVSKENQITKIEINTADDSLRINGIILQDYNRNTVQKILGKPSRIKVDSFRSYVEEFGFDGIPPSSYPIQVSNTYYIYDEIGIMFYTESGKTRKEEPNRFSIHFPNKRFFTHTKDLPFKPKRNFTGIFQINEKELNPRDKLIPDSVDYKTNEFTLFETSFGPTSYTTIIDSIYSVKSKAYMRIYLDDAKTQRVSFIVLYFIPN